MLLTTSNIISFILSIISIIGALLNAYNKISGFYVWVVANIGWLIFSIYYQLYGQSLLWLVYLIICIIGIIKWRKAGSKK